jgi:multicomponent Na+:H+ antiporter subunit A
MASPPTNAHPGGLSLAARAAFVALPLLALVLLVGLLLVHDLPWVWSAPWVPALGIEASFRVDGLSVLMLLMITGVGTAVFVYAGGYLAGHPQQHRLLIMLSLFMVAMIGCVTADDLFVLFLFWEMTSLTAFMLVGFNHDQAASRQSAQQALLVTGTGGLALLAGFILLAQAVGSSRISEIVALLPGMAATPALTIALLLILVGAFTKSAQFPFHFWLPNAMAAPTPVSAYLHSATLVKLGVYLLARLDPGFGDWPMWIWSLKIAGSMTAAWGMVLALRERDLKRILAWSTVATLGTLVMLVGMPGEGATVAVGALLLAHALYKAPLFFVAGNIDHGTGTRVIDRLGNLRHAMPWTAAAALLAGASMAGLPLSLGFIAKDVILVAKTQGEVMAFVDVANTIFGAIAVAVAGVAAVRVFWSHPGTSETPLDAHEGGPALFGPPLVLALVGLLLGLFPWLLHGLLARASVAMTPQDEMVVLNLSQSFGPALGSVAVTLAIGVMVYLLWDPLHRVFERMDRLLGRVSMVATYERSLVAIPRTAASVTRLFQHGRLPGYGLLMMGSVALCLLGLVAAGWGAWVWPAWTGDSLPGAGRLGAGVLIMFGALASIRAHDRLVLLLTASLTGFGSAVFFVFAGAPDVAYTQFVVEAVFVIVVASVLLQLRRRGLGQGLDEPRWRPLAALVALGMGLASALMLLLASAPALDTTLSDFFARASVPDAQGRNVVNVILVDFRALDTLGEVTVVMLSFLAAWGLLRAARGQRNDPAEDRS